MILLIKGSDVDALAQEPSSLKRATETEAMRQDLRCALERDKDNLVTQSTTFARELREMAGPNPQPVNQAFLDDLYGDP
ncbi:hypothetical protein SAMN04487843_107142 [Methylobacterium sp. ap11]|uniref:type II toxin-antitoxin system VapB family antitoxin n=1 Tax=Methylobacterium sp. ap11 TaxID=1761799 RepID=UPI0008B64DFE|nr:type II toxin-antitoxin system VapB family antitoxin [Methylobacterium sp. ap11]SEP14379.1 hypothetical protein SAMN04487843_107142 [Methylobacterium sp. ap11]